MDNEYTITEAGTYNVYFRPNGDGHEDWHYRVIYVKKVDTATTAPTDAPATPDQPTTAPTTAPEAKYYLTGTFNNWAESDADYALAAHDSDDGSEEYKGTFELPAGAGIR